MTLGNILISHIGAEKTKVNLAVLNVPGNPCG